MIAALSALSSKHSIRRKLLWVVITCIFIALVLTGTGMAIYDMRTHREAWKNDLLTQADLLGRASAAALAFDDPKAAEVNLGFLQVRPAIKAAARRYVDTERNWKASVARDARVYAPSVQSS